MICSNFWFKFPGTSSKIEHFISILGKCFDSPWTTRALSETVGGENQEGDGKSAPGGVGASFVRGRKSSLAVEHQHPGQEGGRAGQGVVREGEEVPYPRGGGGHPVHNVRPPDGGQGDQVRDDHRLQRGLRAPRALHGAVSGERSRRHRLRRLLLQPLDGAPLLEAVRSATAASWASTGSWDSTRSTGSSGALCASTRSRGVRRETRIGDIPDVRNDFAFMLHLTDQYDPLYSKRFAVFLSEVSENKLRQMNLNHEWTPDKLRQKIGRSASGGRAELHLFMLAGLPDGVFEVTELESLRLELITDVTIPPSVSQLASLRELALLGCPMVRVQAAALAFLRDSLRVLRVRFSEQREVPPWIYSLKALEELYLHAESRPDIQRGGGGGSSSGGGGGGGGGSGGNFSLESLRELKALRSLHLRGTMSKLPAAVLDVASHLQRLSVNNDGTRMVVLNSLKKLAGLTQLELINCDLERIPHSIFSLLNLQDLDLRDNSLRSIEEILSFQHLHKLTTLKLWHNHIATIPEHIKRLGHLERLYLTRNRISVLPSHLFLCNKLRHLDLAHNEIRFVPPEVGVLQSLLFLSLAGNKVESLPEELFFCRKLKTLRLGGNALTALSPKVASLVALATLELRGNPLEALPAELRECTSLRRAGLVVEQEVYDALPADVRERLERPE
ncbi:unnamed protein product [Lampetra fluviatilis]